ncbi:hypothetical protein JAAARDRAFT_210126 [Jaapia argillacea MUCL 33604]|uniref:Peptidase C14 caspase domain-containing protein n=1 Tax=Jaapia argillacea MUCL 33604 TaxID=933084 RepID=A0A067PH56_9AGAM|nr:hypothetical protein JAAARDRAFT_210126 [Jaapia argillacea MUCL 33604]
MVVPARTESDPGQGGQRPVRRPPARKALLIGINYGYGEDALRCPHSDVSKLTAMLCGRFSYAKDDIVLMLDQDLYPADLVPNETNIRKQLAELVKDAQKGDHFFFYYAGHGHQIRTDDQSEEDGMNEHIVASDFIAIPDDDLKAILVDPLPVGSSLVAIIDCCHSGTMLDLPHSRCNIAYPWKNWFRRGNTRKIPCRQHAIGCGDFGPWAGTILQTSHISSAEVQSSKVFIGSAPSPPTSSGPISPPTSSSFAKTTVTIKGKTLTRSPTSPPPPLPTTTRHISSPVRSNTSPNPNPQSQPKPKSGSKGKKSLLSRTRAQLQSRFRTSSAEARPLLSIDTATAGWFGKYESDPTASSSYGRAQSPEPIPYNCTEDCPQSPTLRPTVISVSSCMDAQVAYEGALGSFFTRALMVVLENNDKPTFTELVRGISSNLELLRREMIEHLKVDSPPQVPSLSSLKRLNMDDVLII